METLKIDNKTIKIQLEDDSIYLEENFKLNNYDFVGSDSLLEDLCDDTLCDSLENEFQEACLHKCETIGEILELDEFKNLDYSKHWEKEELEDEPSWDDFYNLQDHLISGLSSQDADIKLLEFIVKYSNDYKNYKPVFKFEHGNVAYSMGNFTCKWDSGQVGWLLQKTESEYNVTDEFFETLTSWINGEVYGYIVEDETDHVDSCWGFVGDDHLKSGLSEQLLHNFDKKFHDEIKNQIF